MHREHEALRTSGFSTVELRRDISAMEEERDLVMRRIDRMKQKVCGLTPQFQSLMSFLMRLAYKTALRSFILPNNHDRKFKERNFST